MTKYQLTCLLFANNGGIAYKFESNCGKVVHGWLMAVTREDGGGSSFNLLVRDANNVTHNLYFRTID